MKSIISLTYEAEDMAAAAKELLRPLQAETLCKNSVGLLFCDSELEDHRKLLQLLKQEVGFDIVGCTTMATINRDAGIGEMSTNLIVLTADDCRFHTVLSEPIKDRGTVREVVEQAYRAATANVQERPGLILTLPAHNLDVMIDYYPKVLSQVSGGVPVFGGMSAKNAPYGVNTVLYNSEPVSDRMALVVVEGNVKPLFSVAVEMSHLSEGSQIVTRSEENVVYEIDGMSVPEFLESISIDPKALAEDDTDMLLACNPLLLTAPDQSLDDYMLVRAFQTLDLERGCGISSGFIPQGHNIAIGTLTRNDIMKSAEKSIQQLVQQVEEREAADPGYRYSVILCISCAARYMIINPQLAEVGNIFLNNIPQRFHFGGFYSYGELVPTSVKDGKATNTAQNESLILCAL